MVATWPRDNTGCKLASEDCNAFRQHCSQQMYQVGPTHGVGAAELGGLHGAPRCWLQGCCPGQNPCSCSEVEQARQKAFAPAAASCAQAVLSAVKTTFSALRLRLGSKAVGGVFLLERPIFSVDIRLQ